MSAISLISDDYLEEGEIVDDDFEDISDNSIIESSNTGKFASPKDHLPAISLSSVSESDLPEREDTKKFELRHHHRSAKKRCKSYKRRKYVHNYKRYLSDSDSDDYLDRKLQKQLKAAVYVDTEECHKNSLRTRLRAMTKSDENDIIDHINGKSEHDDEERQLKEDSEEPEEDLIQLRLEALRTAILNKYEHRKKRKLKETTHNEDNFEVIEVIDKSDIDKENTQLVNDSKPLIKKICDINSHGNEEFIDTTPPDEDEDVLRAVLLASMSKKITKEAIPPKSIVNTHMFKESVIPKQATVLVENVSPKIIARKEILPLKNHALNRNNFISHMKMTARINPIIINVDDSDTDDDFPNNIIKNPEVLPKDSEIESCIEKLLRDERAKVEAKELSVDQHLTDMNESSTENKVSDANDTSKTNKPIELCKSIKSNKPIVPYKPIIPYKPTVPCKPTGSSKPTTLSKPNEIRKTNNKSSSTSVILEKSAVKLLPKNKQIEYHKLLQKLKNAEKRHSVKHSLPTVNSETTSSKKLIKDKVPVRKNVKKVSNLDIKSDARTLHFALKEMQKQKNGRLQIEEKYVVLTPIIQKINKASMERKKYDQEVKRLFVELAEARNKLQETHIKFSVHVKELMKKKLEIERSSQTLELNGDASKKSNLKVEEGIANSKQKEVAVTSTPKKDHPPLKSFEGNSIASITFNETPNHSLLGIISNSVDDESKDNKKQAGENAFGNAMRVVEEPGNENRISAKKTDGTDIPINPGDPNDIDRIYKTRGVFPEYKSPLECVKRKDWLDPLAIMCPYDMDGKCRDAECIYKHYSN